MSARDAILAAVRRHAPPPRPLPDVASFPASGDLVARFVEASRAVGVRVVETRDVEAGVREAYPEAARVASAVAAVEGTAPLDGRPHALAELDLFVCEGAIGVAENAAVWLGEAAVASRAAPFLAPHVAIVLSRTAIVGTMHDAYDALGAGSEGFGVFVAGPSKTADIEQSLVVGAHGPVSLLVVLVG